MRVRVLLSLHLVLLLAVLLSLLRLLLLRELLLGALLRLLLLSLLELLAVRLALLLGHGREQLLLLLRGVRKGRIVEIDVNLDPAFRRLPVRASAVQRILHA